MLRETSRSEKDRYLMTPLTGGISGTKEQTSFQNQQEVAWPRPRLVCRCQCHPEASRSWRK